ncbi:hypothetical protein [Vibrio sp. L85]|uniref:hypothetical protein n=1 Tax=Vibrio sp. L85 TaxID=1769292 RepID=UPI001116A9F1|nr:hypothetical protein [Vibrio sp. L85]
MQSNANAKTKASRMIPIAALIAPNAPVATKTDTLAAVAAALNAATSLETPLLIGTPQTLQIFVARILHFKED